MTTNVLPPAQPALLQTPSRAQLEQLHGALELKRRRWQGLVALEALALACLLPLSFFWLMVVLDQALYLPLVGRLLACLGLLLSVGWAARYLRRRWLDGRLTQDQTALAIERRTAGVDNRLINAVQLARLQPAHAELTEAIVRENLHALRQLQLEQPAPVRPTLQWLLLTVGVGLIGMVLWLWQPAQFASAVSRILLPLAAIDPAYRTRLLVEPGDTEMAGDVALRITIEGERPEQLVLEHNAQGKWQTQAIAIGDRAVVTHVLRAVSQDTDYLVSGGDYSSPTYRIRVPRKLKLDSLRVTYQYPGYTQQASKTMEGPAGDLEGLQGTSAALVYTFDQPVEAVRLVTERAASAGGQHDSLALTQRDQRTWVGTLTLEPLLGYRLAVTPSKKAAEVLGPFAVRVSQDQEPRLELRGLERRMDAALDVPLALQIAATDDFGLDRVELCYRRVSAAEAVQSQEPWQTIALWSGDRQPSLRCEHTLQLTSLPLSEGEKIEIGLRAKDHCPERKEWTYGTAYELLLGGEDARLQLQYEQLLRSEQDLNALLRAADELTQKTNGWQRKLDGGSDVRWDEPKNIDMLHTGVKALADEQEKLRQAAARVARDMPVQSGNIRLGLGMLADTEMVRVLRIYDSVTTRTGPQAKLAALADARVTLERSSRSLTEMLEQYSRFRSDWELANMIPFTKMLAERQTKLRDQARTLAAPGQAAAEAVQRPSHARRQSKLLALVQLLPPAFSGLNERLRAEDQTLAAAFAKGAAVLENEALRSPMSQAAAAVTAGRWSEAALGQTRAAEQLTQLHDELRKAQVAATKKALADLKERAKSDAQAQKELEKLPPGTAELLVKDFPHDLKLDDTIRLREVAAGKKRESKDGLFGDILTEKWSDVTQDQIELKKDSGVRQDTSTLTLAKEAGKTGVLDMYKSDKHNAVKPFIQDKYDDLVGKLLDEADELDKKYQSIKLSTNQNNNDPGDIGKLGGALNSTGAVAATGNQKPPTTESGGVARTGRQGARAYGMVADKEGVDRRGRDKALDGMEQAPDQQGTIKNKKSDDPATDFSTGIGGKKVESDDNHFSLHDAGKWKDEILKRMEKPQAKNYIVERQDGKIDAKIAGQLRDLESKQEQVIVRLKSIKKELRNLYLPTEHLDELAAALQANLERLQEAPSPELFRLQMQTLDRLRGAVRVFAAASSSFQPSLPRERRVRGRVLDDPTAPTLPGYEDAVKNYYLRLAEQ